LLLSSAKRAASAAAFSAAAASAAAFSAFSAFFRALEDVCFSLSTNESPNVNALGAPYEDPVGNASAPDAPNADSLNK
jgi:hypothetical protein